VSDHVETDVPPAGEQIHVARPSLLPPLLAVGIALALIGVTIGVFLIVIGLVIAVPVLVIWIRSARDETANLPPGH
jgi:hypothetical protein